MRVAAAIASVTLALNGTAALGGRRCTLPFWPSTSHCTSADLQKMKETCPEDSYKMKSCIWDCGDPAHEGCVERCYEKVCPHVHYGCRMCHAKALSCRQCAETRGQDQAGICGKPFNVCIGGGQCSIPEWTNEAQCKTEDLSKIGDESCTSAADATHCVGACGTPAKQSCVQNCYTKQCPDASAKCLSCFSSLYSCAQCSATTKKDATSTCSDPYQVCVGIKPPESSGRGRCSIPHWTNEAQCKTEDLFQIGDGDCTTSDSVVTCTQDCGVPADQACIQACYTKQCPDVPGKCLTCYSSLVSCAQCAATTQRDVQELCSGPYQVCVGISQPAFMV